MTHHQIKHITRDYGEITFTGVPYAYFDYTGKWSIWMISKTFEAARLLLFFNGMFDCHRLLQEDPMFAVRQKIILKPKIREINVQSPITLQCKYKLFHVGNSSITYGCDMFNMDSGEILGIHIIKSVYVNSKSRKSRKFPDWFLDQNADKRKEENYDYFSMKLCSEIPEKSFKINHRIRHSDTDANGHLNQTIYIRLCIDCASEAALAGSYQYFKQNMCKYAISEIEVLHIGECRVGDILELYSWQDISNNACIHFSAYNQGQKHVFQAQFMFSIPDPTFQVLSKI